METAERESHWLVGQTAYALPDWDLKEPDQPLLIDYSDMYEPGQEPWQGLVCTTGEELSEFMRFLSTREWVSLDFETNSLDTRVAQVVGVALGDTGMHRYIPCRTLQAEPSLPWEMIVKPFLADLERLGVRFRFWNAKYDLAIWRNQGLRDFSHDLDRWEDGMIMAHVADPHAKKSLKQASADWLDKPRKKYSQVLNDEKDLSKVRLEDAASYAVEDAEDTTELMPILMDQLLAKGLYHHYQEAKPRLHVCVWMEERGLPCNKAFFDARRQEALSDRAKLLQLATKQCRELSGNQNLQVILGDEEVVIPEKVEFGQTWNRKRRKTGPKKNELNLRSTKQMISFLFDECKVPCDYGKRIKRGINKSMLIRLRRDGLDLADTLLKLSRVNKALIGFYDPLLGTKKAPPKLREDPVTPGWHRAHSTFKPYNTTTSRLASEDMNHQNLMNADPAISWTKVRQGFEAPEGWSLVVADFSQIELRLLAHFSLDPNLIRIYTENGDVHAMTGARLAGVPYETFTTWKPRKDVEKKDYNEENEKYDDYRKRAKPLNFGVSYLMAAPKFAIYAADSYDLWITDDEAAAMIEEWFGLYAGVRRYHKAVLKRMWQYGNVPSLFGRMAYCNQDWAKKVWDEQYNESIPWKQKKELRNDQEYWNGMRQWRQMVNFPIQGGAADMINKAMRQAYKKWHHRNDVRMICQVHDELIFEARSNIAQDIAVDVKRIMERTAVLRVPVQASVQVAQTWLDAH